jgi:pilus assembly protein CpaB
MAQHEALLTTKISGPGSRPTVAAEIADGLRAYTIKVTDATGVGGHALPGDHVDVVLMRDLTPQAPERHYISNVVVQNVRVLGVDLNADPTSEKPATPNTATLEVSVADSQKLSMAANLGTLSLALRKTGEAVLANAPPLRTSDFLGGGGRVTRASSGGSSFSGILIVEGESAKRSRASAAPAAPPAVGGAAAAATTKPASNALGASAAAGMVG